MEENVPVPLIIYVNSTLHSVFSTFELYIKSNAFYGKKSHISNNLTGAIIWYKGKGDLHCGVHDYKKFLDDRVEEPLSEPLLTWRMKIPSRPDGFLLLG